VIRPATAGEGRACRATTRHRRPDIAISAKVEARTRSAHADPWPRLVSVDTIGPVHQERGCREHAGAARVDELELAARLVAGDQRALGDVYERYVGLVFGLARRILRDDAMAEEVTQEVFVYLWEHPARFDASRGTLRAWLGVLAHRRSVDRVRAEERRSRLEARVEPVETMSAAQAEVDEELSRAWLAGCVRDALDQLPADQRDAVVLAYFGGRTFRQVAIDLAIPEGTAKSRLRLGLAKLDALLRPRLIDQDAPAWT
jgi:RNA polymerase sigma-70 factor (ECF subfamily)